MSDAGGDGFDSRRNFLRVGATTLGASALLSPGAPAAQRTTRREWSSLPTKWDRSCDVLVAGGGVGGLVTALRAAQAGAKVILIEASEKTGGTALFSGGNCHVFDMKTFEQFQQRMPTIDPVLGKVFATHWPLFNRWVKALGVPLSPIPGREFDYDLGSSVGSPGYRYKREYCDGFDRLIEAAGGAILTRTAVDRAWQDEAGRVVGMRVLDHEGRAVQIGAKSVVLALGGFAANPQMMVAHFGEWADLAVNRCVPYNTGTGLRIGLECGALLSRGMSKAYGHIQPFPVLVAQTPAEYETSDLSLRRNLLGAVQVSDGAGIIVNTEGLRFFDEADPQRFANVFNAEIVKQPFARAVSIFDDAHASPAIRASMKLIADNGGIVLHVDSLEDLASQLENQFGVRKDNLLRTIAEYNEAIGRGQEAALALPIIRRRQLNTVASAPFHAIPATAGFSMTYGGLQISPRCEVMGNTLRAIPGLFAIPGTAGGLFYDGYIGSLSALHTFGYIAGEAAARSARGA